jgi:hypothetical protein
MKNQLIVDTARNCFNAAGAALVANVEYNRRSLVRVPMRNDQRHSFSLSIPESFSWHCSLVLAALAQANAVVLEGGRVAPA